MLKLLNVEISFVRGRQAYFVIKAMKFRKEWWVIQKDHSTRLWNIP